MDAESSGQTSNVQGEKAKLIKVWNVIKAGVKGWVRVTSKVIGVIDCLVETPARSGTSTIAMAMRAAGVDLGNHLTRPSKTVNPKGFGEDNEVVYKINREIFNQINRTSHCFARSKEILEYTSNR